MKKYTLLLFLSFFILMVSHLSFSQNIWIDRSDNRITFEVIRPTISEDFRTFGGIDFTFFSVRGLVSGRLAINDKLLLVGEIPAAYGEFDFAFADGGSGSLGNIYLGTEIGNRDDGFFVELGTHLPTSTVSFDDFNEADFIGTLADFNETQNFTEDILWLNARANYIKSGNGFSYRIIGGFNYGISFLEDNFGETTESELLYDVAIQAGFDNGKFLTLGGFSSQGIITEQDLTTDERLTSTFGVTAAVRLGRLKPGFNLKVPLSGPTNDLLDVVYGLNMSFLF